MKDNLCYYIYNYDPSECNKTKVDDSEEHKKEATVFLFKTALPLMIAPDSTVLANFLLFSKKCFVLLPIFTQM